MKVLVIAIAFLASAAVAGRPAAAQRENGETRDSRTRSFNDDLESPRMRQWIPSGWRMQRRERIAERQMNRRRLQQGRRYWTDVPTYRDDAASSYRPYGVNSYRPYGINTYRPYGVNSYMPYGVNSFNPWR